MVYVVSSRSPAWIPRHIISKTRSADFKFLNHDLPASLSAPAATENKSKEKLLISAASAIVFSTIFLDHAGLAKGLLKIILSVFKINFLALNFLEEKSRAF